MRFLAIAALLALADARSLPAQSTIEQELKWRVEQLRADGRLVIAGVVVRASAPLLGLYERAGFAPLWTDPRNSAELIRTIRAVRADGLEPAHYHLAALENLANPRPSSIELAERDLLLSAALIRVAYDLHRGKVDPARNAAWSTYNAQLTAADPIEEVRGLITGDRLYDQVLAYRPNHFVYDGLVEALAALRQIQAAGGWPIIPRGPALARDSTSPRVPLLRHRLVLEGDLARDSASADLVFDAVLDRAVRSFQHRHGLNSDGVVGSATLAELNVPVQKRIDQIRVNLERARWVTHDLPASFVAVNVAGAMVYFVRDGKVAFETRAVVGKTYTRTPVFRASMRYIELNPTWSVPPSIVPEILSAVRRDPGYLRAQNIRVLTTSGRAVDPAGIDFSRYSGGNFPYVFRQDPGPLNALGRIKLMFPNSYNVYLHDTPSRALFDREERMFSHGCIRVQHPVQLAALALNDSVRWSVDALEAAINTGVTRTIPVARPLPVIVLYWTASADLHGELHFYRDVYGRDAAVLRALDEGGPAARPINANGAERADRLY